MGESENNIGKSTLDGVLWEGPEELTFKLRPNR